MKKNAIRSLVFGMFAVLAHNVLAAALSAPAPAGKVSARPMPSAVADIPYVAKSEVYCQ
jgi:hypothetical protein